jgi:hypothetical protein
MIEEYPMRVIAGALANRRYPRMEVSRFVSTFGMTAFANV